MFFRMLRTNNQGFTFIELLIALVSISIIAMALSTFITGNSRTNRLVTDDTDTIVTANRVFNSITEELKCGSNFNSSNGGKTIKFVTDSFNAAGQEVTASISWNGSNITLTRDGNSPQTLNTTRDRIENLTFEAPNKYNILIKLTIDGKTYETTIRGLNEYER
jgi:prepilin-type N-terminal cleavage/methylation domain-containing protein